MIVCLAAASASLVPGQSASPAWTDAEFPPYIKRLTHFGERADWSHDGKRLLFLEKMYGDVFELEIATGVIRPLTHHYSHNGYTRALYLPNGDILLSGSKTFNPEAPHWILRGLVVIVVDGPIERVLAWTDRAAPVGNRGSQGRPRR